MTSVRVGFCAAITGIALLVVAVAGIAPWVVGADAECDDRGPHSFFLLAWPAAAFLGVIGAVIIGTRGLSSAVDAGSPVSRSGSLSPLVRSSGS